jgi:ATP-dependent DNA helicase PIF1
MRVYLSGDQSAGRYAALLLKIGNGNIPSDASGRITLPLPAEQIIADPDELIRKVYPDLINNYKDKAWLYSRSIVAPTNDVVNHVNTKILAMIPGEEREYKSADETVELDQMVEYPVEFLNSLNPSGLPPHVLRLKPYAEIMLLRNLNPSIGLMNGTRLQVKRLLDNVIIATIIGGKCEGQDVMIPRIPLAPTDCVYQFRRFQFPVKLSYSMTVNKSQGQTLRYAGLFLEPKECFSHGQLYVSMSRVGDQRKLFVYSKDGKSKNVVHKAAL